MDLRKVLLTSVLVLLVRSCVFADTVAHWDFEEGVNNNVAIQPDSIIDIANGLHGSPIGQPVYTNVGSENGSYGLIFDGVDDRIFVPDDSRFVFENGFSVEAIIRFDGISSGSEYFNQIVFRGDDRGSKDPFFLAASLDGRLAFRISDLTQRSEIISIETLPVGEFIHVAGTFDYTSGEQKIFINGEEVGSKITDVRPLDYLDPSYSPGLGIGSIQSDIFHQNFEGIISEVRISDEVLAPVSFIPEPASLLLLGLGQLLMFIKNIRGKCS